MVSARVVFARVMLARVVVAVVTQQGGVGRRRGREGREDERERAGVTKHEDSPYLKHRPNARAS